MNPTDILTAATNALNTLGLLPFIAGGALVALVAVGVHRFVAAAR